MLIGCNDGGKTTTIEALNYFFNNASPYFADYSYVPEAVPDAEGNRPRVPQVIIQCLFELNTADKAALTETSLVPPNDTINLRKVFNAGDLRGKIEMLSTMPQDATLPSNPGNLGLPAIREYLERLNIRNPGGTRKEPLLEALMTWLRAQPLKEDWVDVTPALLTTLPVFERVEVKNPEDTISKILNITYQQLLQKPEVKTAIQTFNGSWETLVGQPLKDKTSTIINHVKKYLPDIVTAEVNPEFKTNPIIQSAPLTLIGKDGCPINLSSRGAGTRQQVTMAIFDWSSATISANENVEAGRIILAFDEPDLHLDYSAQKRIYQAIETYMKKGIQVVIATHSINLINQVRIESIYHYSKVDSKPQSVIKHMEPSHDNPEEESFFIDKIGESMGFDNATILYERCFLAFEGLTEQVALPILFKKYIDDDLLHKGIRLVNCHDSFGAIVFAKFMHRNKRPVLFLVDEDTTINKGTKRLLTKPALEKDEFSIEKQVHFVSPGCFEFAFSDEVWARVLTKNQPEPKEAWTPEKVKEFKTNAATFIKEIQRVLQEESKPKIGFMLSKTIETKEEIPAGIRTCFDQAVAMANR